MRTVRRSSWEQGIRINYVAPCYIKSAIRSAEYEESLIVKGVEFGLPEDVASCMMRIATDRTINGECMWGPGWTEFFKDVSRHLTDLVGRSLMIVARSVTQEGFVDAGLDDFTEDGYVKSMQELQLRIIDDQWLEDG